MNAYNVAFVLKVFIPCRLEWMTIWIGYGSDTRNSRSSDQIGTGEVCCICNFPPFIHFSNIEKLQEDCPPFANNYSISFEYESQFTLPFTKSFE